MSAAAAEPVVHDGDAPEPPKMGKKKKLIIVIVAAMLVLAVAAGGAVMVIKKKQRAAAEAAAGEDGSPVAEQPVAPKEHAHSGPPTFLPLDPFVVNLADRETERFAQIGITLELDDPKYAEQLKAYMPAIRNGILMTLSGKTSGDLLTRAGKEKLASEVMRDAVRPLGIELQDDSAEAGKPQEEEDAPQMPKTPLEESPVRRVHFSSFIVQ